MELDLENITKEIEAAIEANPECGGNILLQNRVFYRKQRGKHEMLVSLNNKSKRPHYWGHIFWKDCRYVICIIAVDFWLSPYDVQSLFNEFWDNLTHYGWWYPVPGNVFANAENVQDACSNLIQMIKVFKHDRESETFDYRVVQVYPFPDPFKEYA